MTKHTPGPWAVSPRRQYEFPIRSVAMPGLQPIVAQVGALRDGEGGSNARLIAAAPDLLGALKWLAACVKTPGPHMDVHAALEKAQAAIDKATS